MGTFIVPVQVGDLAGQQFIGVEALADTGATYTVLPEDVLARLGVPPVERRAFQLADDRTIEYQVGHVRLRLEGHELIVLAVFAPEGTMPLLGQPHWSFSA